MLFQAIYNRRTHAFDVLQDTEFCIALGLLGIEKKQFRGVQCRHVGLQIAALDARNAAPGHVFPDEASLQAATLRVLHATSPTASLSRDEHAFLSAHGAAIAAAVDQRLQAPPSPPIEPLQRAPRAMHASESAGELMTWRERRARAAVEQEGGMEAASCLKRVSAVAASMLLGAARSDHTTDPPNSCAAGDPVPVSTSEVRALMHPLATLPI